LPLFACLFASTLTLYLH
jgi:cytochrome P450